MISQANNINALDWWREQPRNRWLSISDIPGSIFWNIWNVQIEKSKVELHEIEALYKINKYGFQ